VQSPRRASLRCVLAIWRCGCRLYFGQLFSVFCVCRFVRRSRPRLTAPHLLTCLAMKSARRGYRWCRGGLAEGQATLPNITITEIASLPDGALRVTGRLLAAATATMTKAPAVPHMRWAGSTLLTLGSMSLPPMSTRTASCTTPGATCIAHRRTTSSPTETVHHMCSLTS
jgi:hypothetical protein